MAFLNGSFLGLTPTETPTHSRLTNLHNPKVPPSAETD